MSFEQRQQLITKNRKSEKSAMNVCEVAIIGAGPYGLSIAAHLNARGVDFRIFGSPMKFWLNHMPKGMRLKSEGFASSLYDPGSTFTLEVYCRERGLPYAHIGSPVPLEVFVAYGMEFQRRFVPELEDKSVTSLQRSAEGFQLVLDDGELVTARRVVVAVGLSHFEQLPRELASLSEDFVTHSSRHTTLDHFKGRKVAVVGAGASALDLAALLHEVGASVQVIARAPEIRFHNPPDKLEPSWLDRLRKPVTGIGHGWRLFMCTNLPLVFRQMPEQFRLTKVRRILGPAPGWFVKDQIVGKVPLNLGVAITRAEVQNGQVALQLVDGNGAQRMLVTDHVIAATGYQVNLQRLTFLSDKILSEIKTVDHTPVLSSTFESSVPGLYFVGVSAANTFGPLLRFAFGARFAAVRLSKHLARSTRRPVPARSALNSPARDGERESAGYVASSKSEI
jgi:thioredoxin reductase